MDPVSEKDLLRRLAHGDQTALAALYQEYWQPLYLSAFNVLKDRRACEDIVQELFLQVWVKRETLEVRESLKAYLLTAVRYQVFRAIRKASGQKAALQLLPGGLEQSAADQPLLQKDLKQKVESVVSLLPEKCRQIYRLSREEFLSHKEISERLQISPKTVENQLTIALRRLRHSLDGFFLFLLALAQYS